MRRPYRKFSYLFLSLIILFILTTVWVYDPFELNTDLEEFDLFHSQLFESSTPGDSRSIVSHKLPKELAPLEVAFQAAPFQLENVKDVEDEDFITTLNEVPMRTQFPVGIKNPRNFCYANSVLQSLFRIPVIRKIVANLTVYHQWAKSKVDGLKAHASELREIGDEIGAKELEIQRTEIIHGLHVAEGLNHMFEQLQNLPKGSHAIYSKKGTKCMPKHFINQNQEDADEYLNAMIGYLQGILPLNQRKHVIIQVANFGEHRSLEEPTPLRVENRPITFDKLNRLSLPIKYIKNKTLTKLMQKAFKSEKLELKFDDNTPGELHRFIRLHSLPDVFPIQLQRLFRSHNDKLKKITDEVAMPLEFDFSPFFYEDALTSFGDAKYRLKTIIKHSGSAHGGHYYVYIREDDDKWYLLNDSSATIYTGDIKDILNSGYIYFYERIKTTL